MTPEAPRSRWRRLGTSLIVAGSGAALVCLIWLVYYAVQVQGLANDPGQTMFLSAAGQPLFPLEEHQFEVPLERIAVELRNAVIAVEDKRFFTHGGVDPIAILRASRRNIREGEVVEGASTLTQQLSRVLFLSNSKSYSRKLKEALIATMMEVRLPKERILELYLNRIYFGGDVYGAEAMARNVFGKTAADLSLSESALLAGLIQAPSALWPWPSADRAIARSHVVLRRMREQGFITVEQEEAARSSPPRVLSRPGLDQGPSGYAAQFLRAEFRRRFGDDNPRGWKVHTTLVPELQSAAERAVTDGMKRFKGSKIQAALVAVDPKTGGVLALVGGKDFGRSPFNRAVSAKRQPGSAFKPFLYAAALEQGLSPVSVLTGLDSLRVDGHDEWVVRNVSLHEEDELTLREALLKSDNRAAVALQSEIGSRPVLSLARQVGLEGMPDVPSLALGTGEVTPLQLTAAYAAFVNGGLAVEPYGISQVSNARGSAIMSRTPEVRRVLSEASSFQMLSMLEDVVLRGTGASARSLGVRFPAGGKTGTTDDFRDAWFVGFSSSVVAGVWTGFDQPARIASDGYGSRYALPFWAHFMANAARTRPPKPFVPPASVTTAAVCQESHMLATAYCVSRKEYFKSGDDIPGECYLHGSMLRRIFGGFIHGLGRWVPN